VVAQPEVADGPGELAADRDRWAALPGRDAAAGCRELLLEQRSGQFRPVPDPVEVRVVGGLGPGGLGYKGRDGGPRLRGRPERRGGPARAARVEGGGEKGARVGDPGAHLAAVPARGRRAVARRAAGTCPQRLAGAPAAEVGQASPATPIRATA
jgi:hypothetical protein